MLILCIVAGLLGCALLVVGLFLGNYASDKQWERERIVEIETAQKIWTVDLAGVDRGLVIQVQATEIQFAEGGALYFIHDHQIIRAFGPGMWVRARLVGDKAAKE